MIIMCPYIEKQCCELRKQTVIYQSRIRQFEKSVEKKKILRLEMSSYEEKESKMIPCHPVTKSLLIYDKIRKNNLKYATYKCKSCTK